ncbi:MAG: 2Fe-2S iron-sulfur cluster-binding protein [Vicinamibacteria bacterium]|nr:2Fe-2S iron-sulfur cluster-binding protein [Vicinamibacteria bacterium]
MSDDLFEPWEKLVPIVMLGRRLEVPENNVLLRQLQHLAPDIGYGKYCWNAECRYCEVTIRQDGREYAALACRVKAVAGMEVVKAAPEIKYNCSEALQAAPKAGE